MKAMILAAGLGTRLRPLTNDRPKALVEVGGRTLLEITTARLREFGVRELVINVHYHPAQIVDCLKNNRNFGMERVEISHEENLLDTGGGLKKAAWFFLEDSSHREEPFILHNVDVISTIDFQPMIRAHSQNGALATLAVQNRQTSRYLLFDQHQQLCGRRKGPRENDELVREEDKPQAVAFCGVHVISPRLLKLMNEQGAFSIIDSYLRIAGEGEPIMAFLADDYYWRDLGRPEDLAQAQQDLKEKTLQLG